MSENNLEGLEEVSKDKTKLINIETAVEYMKGYSLGENNFRPLDFFYNEYCLFCDYRQYKKLSREHFLLALKQLGFTANKYNIVDYNLGS